MVRFPKLLTRMLQLLLLVVYISMTLATDETMDPNSNFLKLTFITFLQIGTQKRKKHTIVFSKINSFC